MIFYINLHTSVTSWWFRMFQRLYNNGLLRSPEDITAMLLCNIGSFGYWGRDNIYTVCIEHKCCTIADVLHYITGFEATDHWMALHVDESAQELPLYQTERECLESNNTKLELLKGIIYGTPRGDVALYNIVEDLSVNQLYEQMYDTAHKVSEILNIGFIDNNTKDDCVDDPIILLFQ